MGFTCSTCGKYHEQLPMDVAFERPADYFKVSQEERNKRIYFTEDFCVIDDKEFYVRGVLEIPVKNSSEKFGFGIWARIREDDFLKYINLWNVPEIQEPPFHGRLSGGIKFYDKSDLLEVKVYLQPHGNRPTFEVVAQKHPLGLDQRNGITMEKVHKFVEPLLK